MADYDITSPDVGLEPQPSPQEPDVRPSEHEDDTLPELDLEGIEPAQQEPRRRPAQQRDPSQDRIAQLEYQLRYMQGLIEGRTPQQQQRRQWTPETLQRPEDWMEFVREQAQEAVNYSAYQSQGIARLANSEAHARGIFNASEMGSGLDYDNVIGTYVAPIENNNPTMTQFFNSQPHPGLARMFIGLMHYLAEQNGGDPVKTAKAIINASAAEERGASNLKRQINQAAKSGADKIFGNRGRSGGSGNGRVRTAEDVWSMSDAEFRKHLNRLDG